MMDKEQLAEKKLTEEEIALMVEIAKLETATPLFNSLLKKRKEDNP